MILLRITHTAQRQHSGVTGLEAKLAGEIFTCIRFDTAVFSHIEQSRSFHHHQFGGFELRPALRQRMLNALVLTDGPVEDDTFACITRGARDRSATNADRFCSDEHTLRIESVQKNLEALALRTD